MNDRYAMPGSAPTDEDLQHEIELTRQELGRTLTQLTSKLDVKTRTRRRAQSVTAFVRDHPLPVVAGLVLVIFLTAQWTKP